MNEVSKCAEINCTSFNNLHIPLADVKIEILALKANVRKLLLSSIVAAAVVLPLWAYCWAALLQSSVAMPQVV